MNFERNLYNCHIYLGAVMIKKIFFCFLIFASFFSYAEKVGEEISYYNSKLASITDYTLLTRVEPMSDREGHYSVELTSIIMPAGGNSVVGTFTLTTHYTVKVNDKITLFNSGYPYSTPITLIISKIKNNEIEFSTISDVLNEE